MLCVAVWKGFMNESIPNLFEVGPEYKKFAHVSGGQVLPGGGGDEWDNAVLVCHDDGGSVVCEGRGNFTFTRPPQCLSCRGHFYYRIIPCQYKVHINITRMEVVTSQIRKTW